jgi:hypothetical protein
MDGLDSQEGRHGLRPPARQLVHGLDSAGGLAMSQLLAKEDDFEQQAKAPAAQRRQAYPPA